METSLRKRRSELRRKRISLRFDGVYNSTNSTTYPAQSLETSTSLQTHVKLFPNSVRTFLIYKFHHRAVKKLRVSIVSYCRGKLMMYCFSMPLCSSCICSHTYTCIWKSPKAYVEKKLLSRKMWKEHDRYPRSRTSYYLWWHVCSQPSLHTVCFNSKCTNLHMISFAGILIQ